MARALSFGHHRKAETQLSSPSSSASASFFTEFPSLLHSCFQRQTTLQYIPACGQSTCPLVRSHLVAQTVCLCFAHHCKTFRKAPSGVACACPCLEHLRARAMVCDSGNHLFFTMFIATSTDLACQHQQYYSQFLGPCVFAPVFARSSTTCSASAWYTLLLKDLQARLSLLFRCGFCFSITFTMGRLTPYNSINSHH